MIVSQHNIVSSAVTQVYNSTASASNIVFQNMGPSYKIVLLSSSNQALSLGYPVGPHCAFSTPIGSANNVFACLSPQVGANASTVVAKLAVFATP